MDVHTRRLRYFVILAEELHFTRAANRLHVSQQGLSRSIRELEEQVGAVLLRRTTRTVVLTEAGEEFLRGVRDGLAALDASAEAARRAQAKVGGELRIGFLVSSALELTPPIIRAFRERYPAVSIELVGFSLSDPSCGLRSRQTEVAFVRLPIDCPDLQTELLFVEPRAVGVGRSHPLAGARTVKLSELSGELITTPRTDDATWEEFWTLRDTGLDESLLPRLERVVSSVEEELEAVSAGLAICVTALSMSRYTPRPTIVFRPIEDVPGSPLALCWRGAGTALSQAFRDVAVEVKDREADLVARIEAANGVPADF